MPLWLPPGTLGPEEGQNGAGKRGFAPTRRRVGGGPGGGWEPEASKRSCAGASPALNITAVRCWGLDRSVGSRTRASSETVSRGGVARLVHLDRRRSKGTIGSRPALASPSRLF